MCLARWGDEVQALGFPEESTEGEVVPTARLLSGGVQRFFFFESRLGYSYQAGEVGFGAPAGMSGGPVFSPRDLTVVTGLMAENIDSTTYLRSVEEVQENGEVYKNRLHEVIRYGIFVHLPPLRSWLEELIPSA